MKSYSFFLDFVSVGADSGYYGSISICSSFFSSYFDYCFKEEHYLILKTDLFSTLEILSRSIATFYIWSRDGFPSNQDFRTSKLVFCFIFKSSK